MAQKLQDDLVLSVEQQALLSRAVALFSGANARADAVSWAGSGHALFTGSVARFSNGLTGLEIPFAGLSGRALPVGPATEVIFRGEEELRVALSDGAIRVTAGDFSANLRFISGESLREWPALGKVQEFPVTAEAWAEASSVAFASESNVRSELAGVVFYKTTAFATDGVRAARVLLKKGVGDKAGFVPFRLIDVVDKVSAVVKPVAIIWEENRAWVRFEGGALAWALLPAREYPVNVLSVLAQQSKKAGPGLQVFWGDRAEDASRIVERVSVFADDSEVAVQADGDVLRVCGKGARGEASGKIPVKLSAALKEASVNGAMLADAVRRSRGMTAVPGEDCFLFRRPGFELLVMCLVG